MSQPTVTLHRIAALAIPFSFTLIAHLVSSKAFHAIVTLGVCAAVMQLIGWWERNPPEKLKWYFNTDWERLWKGVLSMIRGFKLRTVLISSRLGRSITISGGPVIIMKAARGWRWILWRSMRWYYDTDWGRIERRTFRKISRAVHQAYWRRGFRQALSRIEVLVSTSSCFILWIIVLIILDDSGRPLVSSPDPDLSDLERILSEAWRFMKLHLYIEGASFLIRLPLHFPLNHSDYYLFFSWNINCIVYLLSVAFRSYEVAAAVKLLSLINTTESKHILLDHLKRNRAAALWLFLSLYGVLTTVLGRSSLKESPDSLLTAPQRTWRAPKHWPRIWGPKTGEKTKI